MSTRRVDRPYVRPRRVQHGARGLAELAGHAGSGSGVGSGAERATVERLEPRQLLFSLTITPDLVNPATGLGTVEAAFGYTIPILQTPEEVADNDPESQIEGFDQEPLTPVVSGRRFGTDGLAVTHTISNPVSRFFMFALVDNQGQIIDGTEAIRANPFAGEAYRWRVLDDPMGPINGSRRVMTDFTMQIGAAQGTNQGWTVDALEVRLRLNGVVVREFIGQEILQARQPGTGGANNGIGVYNFTTGDPLFPAFDEIEFLTVSGPNPAYTIDNVGWTEPAGNFAEIIESRTFGAIVSFTGPVGANVTVLDLYGRDMVATLLVGQIGQSEVTFIDPDDNGIPNFNDGIGQILLSGVDTRASLRVFGGTIATGYDEDGFWVQGPFGGGSPQFVPEPQDDEGYFSLIPAGGVDGLMDDFEEAGFGVFYTDNDGATGLPEVGGSVIIGSPIFRPLNSYNPQGRATGQGSFSPDRTAGNFSDDAHIMPTQGIFVLDGTSMGEIATHGMLYGSSRFEGALRSLSVGVLMGSVSVEGDLGSLYVNGDAGFWQIDPDFPTPPPDNTFKTGGQLIVGRTLGDVSIGGRSVLDITVVGDVSSPQSRPPLDQFIYREKEVIFPVDEGAQYAAVDYIRDVGQRFFRNGNNTLRNPRFLGGEVFRNDQIGAAEFISTTGTAVNVVGSIGAGDPAMNSNEDPSDVYAFASDGRTPVVLEIEGQDVGFFGAQLAIDGALVRFADANGNTLAANSFNEITSANQRIVFTPEAPGIYYLIFQVPGQTDGDFDGSVLNYQFLLSGIAPTTFGNYLSAASTGGVGVNGGNAAINVLAGSLGLFRVGMGSLAGGGQFVDPTDVTNSTTALESLLNVETMSLSVARGNAYAIITGSDIEGGDQFGQSAFFIAGDLGAFITGQSPLLEQGPEVGDVGVTSLTVGGRVGLIDIRGGIGQQS
ncbi:MAG: hypothetical protein KDA05_00415, partial [Phycisphaerales bacterium]|nr:hypothetical protein [Phycisphaerales bacterium]